MSLEQISLIAQVVSAVAVIASLIFVGRELNQATHAMRNASSQAHSSNYTDIVKSIIENGDFAKIWLSGLNDPDAPSDEEWARFVGEAEGAISREHTTWRATSKARGPISLA